MKARILLNKNFIISPIDPRIYGGFAEHLGRCIYEGIYEPEHPDADDNGFRTDVLDLVKDLQMPVMRYPGGNFVSGYNWEDGIGPKNERPSRPDGAWQSIESNQFGTDEFVDWCRLAKTEPMLAVNLGTRGPDDARNLVEYCNFPKGTKYSDMRREYGHEDPHNVQLWCLGNEMDGPWQIGHKTAYEYGRCACEAAKLMKMVDPTIELVVCGSSGPNMSTFGEWEAEVLDHTLDQVDYISIHQYFGKGENDDTPKFLSAPERMNAFIKKVIACCDFVSAKRKSNKKIMLSFDEWNTWYHSHGEHAKYKKNGIFCEAPHILEDVYNFEDVLVVGSVINNLINNADRVKIACIAQIVNVIAPIMTIKNGRAWKQTTYYPLFYASNYGRGMALQQVIETPDYSIEDLEHVPYISSSAIKAPDGSISMFIVNRSPDSKVELEVLLQDFGDFHECEWELMISNDLLAANTEDNPERVVPEHADTLKLNGNTLCVQLSPVSWNMLTIK